MKDLTTEQSAQEINEVWKPVFGFEGVYEVSNQGRIKRIKAGRGAVAGKILSLNRINKKGYPTVYLHKDENGIRTKKPFATHIVVAAAFLSPKPSPLHQVNHKDGVKTNNASDNLEWVTNNENMAHSWAIGLRHNIGENSHTAKLTEQQVREIINLKGKVSQSKIAALYSIHLNHVKSIHNGKTWKHITHQPDVKEKLASALPCANIIRIGTANNNAKLDESKVSEIKKLLPVKGNREISRIYGVDPGCIALIRHGKTWKHVNS